MAMKYLGDTFDLHAGGEDLMFPHHENEIAQSESATGKTFARHWMHVRFLLVEGRKMSKSEGNFYTLRDLLLKGYRASAIRFPLISVPYRHQLNFTFDGLAESTNAIDRLRTFHQRLVRGGFPAGDNPESQAAAKAAHETTSPPWPTTSTPPKPAPPSSISSAPPTPPPTRASSRRRTRCNSQGARCLRWRLRCA